MYPSAVGITCNKDLDARACALAIVAEDIAEAIVHAIEVPGHVNLDMITIRPVAQAAQHKLVRGPLKPRD